MTSRLLRKSLPCTEVCRGACPEGFALVSRGASASRGARGGARFVLLAWSL